jgi:hypothetical protein
MQQFFLAARLLAGEEQFTTSTTSQEKSFMLDTW